MTCLMIIITASFSLALVLVAWGLAALLVSLLSKLGEEE